ncbi:uncharacterized protein C10orf120 homolog isoform X1 [Eschrichtius robustus]|uniref:uncharacterized protein C10orf120 homolog isoform X1 n=1 Tax=Eschrichtius robustus TaxID=9764 RepID=UPI0035BF7B0D
MTVAGLTRRIGPVRRVRREIPPQIYHCHGDITSGQSDRVPFLTLLFPDAWRSWVLTVPPFSTWTCWDKAIASPSQYLEVPTSGNHFNHFFGYGPNSTNQTHALPSGNTPPWKKRSYV